MTCYAPEDGPVSEMHVKAFATDAALQCSLEFMENYHAACATSRVSRMVFRTDRIDVKMDTRESLELRPAVEDLADFLQCGEAAESLVLVFATPRFDVINVDPRLWKSFTTNASAVYISGTLYPVEIVRLVKTLVRVEAVNMLNQRYLDNGSLVNFSRWIPVSVTQLM